VRGLLLAVVFLAAGPAFAQQASAPQPTAGEIARQDAALADPVLEVRAQNLADEIRCVVCENEPVSRSNAAMAVDMRHAIRERVAAGDSDDQVRAYFAERYGEFVLLRPRFSAATIALWALPFVLLLLAGAALLAASRRRAEPALAGEDRASAEAALAALGQTRRDESDLSR
jgi:cytochrome c-type biogenesis protein CcmH